MSRSIGIAHGYRPTKPLVLRLRMSTQMREQCLRASDHGSGDQAAAEQERIEPRSATRRASTSASRFRETRLRSRSVLATDVSPGAGSARLIAESSDAMATALPADAVAIRLRANV